MKKLLIILFVLLIPAICFSAERDTSIQAIVAIDGFEDLHLSPRGWMPWYCNIEVIIDNVEIDFQAWGNTPHEAISKSMEKIERFRAKRCKNCPNQSTSGANSPAIISNKNVSIKYE